MSKEGVKVRILDRDFTIACCPGEKAAVESAAQYLNAQIKVVQDQSKVIGIENTVVLAALNMANELISDQPIEVDEVVINRVRGLRQRIAAAISED